MKEIWPVLALSGQARFGQVTCNPPTITVPLNYFHCDHYSQTYFRPFQTSEHQQQKITFTQNNYIIQTVIQTHPRKCVRTNT